MAGVIEQEVRKDEDVKGGQGHVAWERRTPEVGMSGNLHRGIILLYERPILLNVVGQIGD